ncbi:FecCD family ABC transporter permease [Streptomyces sp. CA-111067]|uniref:FecCD family ABC transporter permease n=1 Tax=Streptomyces sp. CA-111067 TaxID=3240046 RepID=UPI003D970DDC
MSPALRTSTAPVRVDTASRRRAVRLWGGHLSRRVSPRAAAVCLMLALATVAAGLATLLVWGGLPFGEVLRTLQGHGTVSDEFIVYTVDSPRLLCAVMVGLALGASGAIFQSVSKNPLGSPDIIGFTMGSSAGAVFAITVLHAGYATTSLGALAGGFGSAVLVYLLALRHGVQGQRLVIVGIAVSLMLGSVVNYLLTRSTLQGAQEAQVWLTGSLSGLGWDQLYPALAAVPVLLLVACLLVGRLNLLELGDDTARGLGMGVERSRLALLALGVALVAVATATAGPISFVALTAPQLARRLTGAPGAGVFPAALMGAVLLVVGDIVAQHAFGVDLPVGVATGALGGLYMAWLLAGQWRTGRA